MRVFKTKEARAIDVFIAYTWLLFEVQFTSFDLNVLPWDDIYPELIARFNNRLDKSNHILEKEDLLESLSLLLDWWVIAIKTKDWHSVDIHCEHCLSNSIISHL